MNRVLVAVGLAISLCLLVASVVMVGMHLAETYKQPTVPPVGIPTSPVVEAASVRVPLYFEPNEGQTDTSVRYLSRGAGYSVLLTGSGAVLSLGSENPATLRMDLVGAAPDPVVSGLEKLSGESN
jgi:hypothetical protein